MSDILEPGKQNVSEIPYEYAASATGISVCPFCGSKEWRCAVKGDSWEFTCGSCGKNWMQNPIERVLSSAAPGKKWKGAANWQDIIEFFLPRNLTPSEITLILVNLIPIAGMLFFGWRLFDIFFLYWLESAIMGFFGILKMIVAGFYSGSAGVLFLFFLVPFFIFHYGMFMFVHFLFIFFLSGNYITTGAGVPFSTILETAKVSALSVSSPFILIFMSHMFSFFTNFIGKREFAKAQFSRKGTTMFLPYGRIFVMHLSIFLAFFVVGFLRLPALAPGLIIVTKIVTDLRAHRREHAGEGVLVHSVPRGQS